MEKIAYGSKETTELLDNEGSTITKEVKFFGGGIASKPIRHTFKIRVKVKNQQQEHEQYVKFSDDLRDDPTMLDPSFGIERTKASEQQGFYFVIRRYTKLEY